MAIGALLGLGRIVKRPRAFTGNTRRLPVIVLVEAAKPAIIVDWHVQVNFVTGRTELRRLRCVEALQKRFAMRLWMDAEQVVGSPLEQFVIAGRQIVQRRILDGEVTLPHRALDVDYRVARRAAQSVLRFGSIDLFFYW